MGHVELRDIDDDDLDAVFEAMRQPGAVTRPASPAADPDDRAAFDEWMQRERRNSRTSLFIVTEDGGFAGSAALVSVDGDREVTYWIARHARGRNVASEALRLLVASEAERPLYARVASNDIGSVAALERLGFTRLSPAASSTPNGGAEAGERVYVLPPVLE